MKIVLASGSSYRKKAFARLGIKFECLSAKAEEKYKHRPSNPEKLVIALARLKAEIVAAENKKSIVIGLDSVGYFKGELLEKPKSKTEAAARLSNLSGQRHYFYTGLYAVNTATGKHVDKITRTTVYFREVTKTEIDDYLNEDRSFQTYAAGYDPVSHLSSSFISRTEGSLNNILWGMPLEIIPKLLFDLGYNRI